MTPKINTKTAGPTMAVLMIVLLVVAAVLSNVFQRRPHVRTLDRPATSTTAPASEGTFLPTD
jgi:hypothetical protein